MTSEEIKKIIRNGENSFIEFKRDDISPEQLAKEIVAFTNLKGGSLLLGVEDDGNISGLTMDNCEEWVMSAIAEIIHPTIFPFYEEVLMGDHKIAVITVPMGPSKPYHVKKRGRYDAYVRLGSQTRLAKPEELRRLFQMSGLFYGEFIPVHRSLINTWDLRRLQNYFQITRNMEILPLLESIDEWKKLALHLEWLTELENNTVSATLAGHLFFHPEPKKYLAQAGLSIVVFRGKEKDYDAVARETVDLPLVALFSQDSMNIRKLQEEGLIEYTLRWLQPYLSKEVLVDNIRRERMWDYPQEVLREALLNAFAHRDWTIQTDVELSVYEDRLEVISPGSLPNTVTVERMKQGCRIPRNPLIMQALKDYGYVESMGMGVRNKIIKGMKNFNNKEPLIEADENQVKLVLWK